MFAKSMLRQTEKKAASSTKAENTVYRISINCSQEELIVANNINPFNPIQ